MTPVQLKRAREKLGLSIAQAALLLETSYSTVKRMERDGNPAARRAPPPRAVRLYDAMLYGWRPDDFPGRPLAVPDDLEDLI